MKIQLIRLFSALVAGALVMILHEFPKAFIFSKLKSGKDSRHYNIYKLYQYIDPIGLLLCVTSQTGFSKPYMYRIKDKKANFILGITGYISLFLTFSASVALLRFKYGNKSSLYYSGNIPFFELMVQFVLVYIALISISMFLVNLFPISTFDMGLCIAGISPARYFVIIRNDYLIKVILLVVIIMNFISSFSTRILIAFLQ